MIRRTLPAITVYALVAALSACASAGGTPEGPTTRVVLHAVPVEDNDATEEVMSTAADTLRGRLTSDDRTVHSVAVEGETVTLDVTGTVDKTDPLLTQPGQLAFRQVLALAPAGSSPAPPDVPSIADDVVQQFETLDCAAQDQGRAAGDPDLPLVTCDEEGSKFLLAPAEIVGTDVAEASSSLPSETSEWIVTLEFDDGGSEAFGEITGRLQQESSPRNQFAITVDGVVLSAPAIPPGAAITGGVTQISGAFTKESAETLASQLDTAPLPFPFEVRSISTPSSAE